MEIARTVSRFSYSNRDKVGAVIVDSVGNIQIGYNGTPSGFPNVCEDENGVTLPEVLHAESNAILKAARSTISTQGSTLFVTLSPCVECAKLIIQSGIKHVVFENEYRNTSGIELLQKSGILVTRFENY